jgi:L-lactate dehydrogenase
MKIGIVGVGAVGATTAYALVMRGVGSEIVLVDIDIKRSQAEAQDISHATPFAHPTRVSAGDYPDLVGCRAVVIAAGTARQPGESRLELLSRNAGIFREIVPQIITHAREAVLLIATNPVDIMTHITADAAAEQGVPSSRVIGSGTTLDTARFRSLVGLHLGIDPHHVHGYVLGEHGDSEVIPWSLVTVGGISLEAFAQQFEVPLSDTIRSDITRRVQFAGRDIIQGKGRTNYGIGSALVRILEVIIRDQRALLTVCTPVPNVMGVENVTVSLPHLVGGSGILDTILLPLALTREEEEALRRSAQVVKDAYESLTGFPE